MVYPTENELDYGITLVVGLLARYAAETALAWTKATKSMHKEPKGNIAGCMSCIESQLN